MTYYDRAGRPITLEDWCATWDEHRQVARDVVGRLRVSTVWLGLDHQWQPGGPPLIFETMVFPPWDYSELFVARYSTEAEARGGHRLAVVLARARRHGWTKHARDEKRWRMKWDVEALAHRHEDSELGEMARMSLRLGAISRGPA